MKRVTASDTLTLSIPERILLVEEIWNTIVENDEMVETTDEDKIIINQRLQAYHKNPNAVSKWKDVYKRIVSEHSK